ncbi:MULTISPECIES: hypothetical protein [unclassified Mycolicibacterium]|uniref:hypothetical protein n=1 Tax=unclassified Mycolicibacterium TaxID=2636767 RepID=UPI0012DF1A51|nr:MULTISPECIES: hypothetical protein [unclassified Mycolicibacterium]
METPRHLRLRRGLERDGAAAAVQWHELIAAEDQHFAQDHTRDRADIVVMGYTADGTAE